MKTLMAALVTALLITLAPEAARAGDETAPVAADVPEPTPSASAPTDTDAPEAEPSADPEPSPSATPEPSPTPTAPEGQRAVTVSRAVAGGTACDPEQVRVVPSVGFGQRAGAPVAVDLLVSTTALEACTLLPDEAGLIAVVSDGGTAVWRCTRSRIGSESHWPRPTIVWPLLVAWLPFARARAMCDCGCAPRGA